MSRKLVFLIRILSLQITLLVFPSHSQLIVCKENLNSLNSEISDSSGYVFVPFHYQSNDYYCGPAALEMVFDYYGEDIPQTEIADVARTYPYTTHEDELRRAAHFSNLSTSSGDEIVGSITGYSARKVGYAAFEERGLAVDDLKNLITEEEPVIVLMWWSPAKVYGHYRVVVGYNETHIIMHDPWNKDAWGGTYGGANTSMTYSAFLDLWEYSGNWGLWIHLWDVRLQMPSTAGQGGSFELIADVAYPSPTPFNTADYLASSCKATIELQEGLEVALGETTQHSLGNISAGNSVQTSWSIQASATGSYNISITVAGIVGGNVGSHGTYPSYTYEDAIGGSCIKSLSVIDQSPTISILSPENRTYPTSDVSLTFTLSESPSWVGYSLDGQMNVTITGNTTLSGLSDGSHSLTVYARDTAGNSGASDKVYFNVETPQPEPFPVEIVAVTGIVVVVGAVVLVYLMKFKK